MNSIKAIAISIALLSFSNFALASPTTMLSCSKTKIGGSQDKGSQDYGDATSSYGSACNKTARWQRLGTKWDTDSFNQATDADNATDDGVSWKTSSDGGSTWTNYSTTGKLTRGDLVKFKFKMTRSTDGNHKYDQVKSWVDWNGNGSWANNSEKIIQRNWWKNQNSSGVKDGGGTWNNDIGDWNSNDTYRAFYKKMTIPLDAALGDTWLRARVVCENSLQNTNYNHNYNMLPNGFEDQGETEDYRLTIVARTPKPPVDVPEPSTLFLFMIGSVAILSKRKKLLSK